MARTALGPGACSIGLRTSPAHDQVWRIRIGDQPAVEREPFDDGRIYVSVECECAWEPEHGLQIVFLEGRTVTKVGPYDGHLTNVAAYDRPDLAEVIYRRMADYKLVAIAEREKASS